MTEYYPNEQIKVFEDIFDLMSKYPMPTYEFEWDDGITITF